MDLWVVKLGPDPLSVNDVKSIEPSIHIYPNPADNEIRFSEKVNVKLINQIGQTIAFEQHVNVMDISSKPAGIYFLILYEKQGQVFQRAKLVKQ